MKMNNNNNNPSPGSQMVFGLENKHYLVLNDGYVKIGSNIPVTFDV